MFCRLLRWVELLWVSRSLWYSSWRYSCCIAMETSRSSSAWCCSARSWPGICVSSSSLSYLWMSARSVMLGETSILCCQVCPSDSRDLAKTLNSACFFPLSIQTIYKQCIIDHEDHKSLSTVTPLPSNHTTANVSVTPTKRLGGNTYQHLLVELFIFCVLLELLSASVAINIDRWQ